MARRAWSESAKPLGWRLLLALAVLVALPGVAQAQVQGCQVNQYLDRTAADADRQLVWDFDLGSDSERCLQVRTGQTVVWGPPDFELHPLAGLGGDLPNPISSHQAGSVTFNSPGTFGFICTSHTSMKGAIKVVQAPPPQAAAVPALASWLAATLALVLLAGAVLLIRRRDQRMALGS